jgi:N-methylhydantoinase A
LGYLNPEFLVGGDLRIEPEKAERAVARDIAEPLGLSILKAAEGIHRIANATMHRAIRSVTIERGRDPRDFTLIAFGGSGPVHAAGLAGALEISAVLVPPHPGVFSSFGLLVSEVEHLYTRSLLTDLAKFSPAITESVLGEMEVRAREDFAAEGFTGERLLLRRFADVRYRRQIYDLLLPLPDRPLEEGDRDRLAAAFHEEHRRTYGYAMEDERLELVSLKVRAQGVREGRTALPWSGAENGDGPRPSGREERMVYFGEKNEKVRTSVIGRADLGEAPVEGPLIVEEYDSTTVVPPGMRVRREASGFLLLEG